MISKCDIAMTEKIPSYDTNPIGNKVAAHANSFGAVSECSFSKNLADAFLGERFSCVYSGIVAATTCAFYLFENVTKKEICRQKCALAADTGDTSMNNNGISIRPFTKGSCFYFGGILD